MTRCSCKIGYGETVEDPPGSGVWVNRIIERRYFGNVEWSNRRFVSDQNVNDNVALNNYISVVADSFANDNFMNIAYVLWRGFYWDVTNVEVKHPRLMLYIGARYNGSTAETS